jgi:hypothetical protein
MVTLSILLFASFAATKVVPDFSPIYEFENISITLAFTSLSGGLITALVASTIYSLRGEPFCVSDILKYRPIMHPWDARKIRYKKKETTTWYIKTVVTIERVMINSANKMIESLANSYNSFVVRFINNLAKTILEIMNTIRRALIKIALHLSRSFQRFFHIVKWSVQWALHTAIRYSEIFLIPILFIYFGSFLLYGVSEDFFEYVHSGLIFLPVIILIKIISVIIMFSIASSLLLHLRFFNFFEKVLNALSIFGTSAFLFFILISWGFGAVGSLTDGPYRIGWVTISSTLLPIVVFLISRRQEKITVNMV